MTEAIAEATFKRCRDRQIRKFDSLLRSSKPCPQKQTTIETTNSVDDKQKWIVNLSKHQLNEEETSVLTRGLNFAPTPSRIPISETIAGVEPALRTHHDDAKTDRARAAICNILRKAKPPRENTTKGERQALKNLQGNKDIVIVQADKRNATVIMDTNEYEDKALAILGKAPFARLQKDPTKKIEREINERLRNFMAQGNLNKIEYETLRVSAGCSKPALFLRRKCNSTQCNSTHVLQLVGSLRSWHV